MLKQVDAHEDTYVSGKAVAVISTGEQHVINLDDIYLKAAAMLGMSVQDVAKE